MPKLKSILNRIGPALIEKFGIIFNPLILNINKEKNQLLVFYFHSLFESNNQKEINHIDPQHNMTVSQFREFIDYFLEYKFRFLVPEDLSVEGNNDSPGIMITFDDGYFNNRLAIKILEEYQIPGLFFLSTRNIVDQKSYWWDVVYRNRIKQGKNIQEIRKEQELLKLFKHDFIDNYIIKNFGNKAFNPWSDVDRPFNQEEIKGIAQNKYVSIGNHTHNHAILTNHDENEIVEDLRISNQIIFDLTGTNPISFAFPNGNYNQLALNIVEREGFKFAFTTNPTLNIFPRRHKGIIQLDRYMSTTIDINKYGSFYRLGYQPRELYRNLKKRVKSSIINTEEYA